MPDTDLHNLNDLLAELEGTAVETSQGTFVKMEDVKRLLKMRTDAAEKSKEAAAELGPLKTVEQARAAIKRDPELLKSFAGRPQDTGRAVAAQEPQPVSRP